MQEALNFPVRKKLSTRHSLKKKSLENSPIKERSVPLKKQKSINEANIKAEFTSPRTPLSPKNLNIIFKKEDLENDSVLSATKRCLNFTENSPVLKLVKNQGLSYKKTKQVLQTSIPDTLLCREKEMNYIFEYISTKVAENHSGSLYISGPPGTGKTAVLAKAMERLKSSKISVKSIFINCMSFANSQAIFAGILQNLNLNSYSAKDSIDQIEKHFETCKNTVLLVLDEIDSLDTRNQETLYKIFEWPRKFKIIIIGIANSLDLTDRILPRLQSQKDCRPELLTFRPYSREEISTILKSRLEALSGDGIVEIAAVQFCARKISAVSGDMRKALEVCRRAVELVELDACKQTSIAENGKPKMVGVAAIMKILNETSSGTLMQRSNEKKLDLPLHQALALCTLLIIVRKNGSKIKETTLGKMHESFAKVCIKHGIAHCDQSEFISMCELIETHGLISIKRTKEVRTWKISLRVNETELENILQDKTLISSVIQIGF